jgi:hypothetical protein
MEDLIDLYAVAEDELALEELPEGNALASFSTSTSASTASCPATSASSASSVSSYG